MRKIYLTILASVFIFSANAQLNLTKATTEPVLGDVNIKQGYDSVGILPKNAGAGQLWDFSALTTNTVVEVSTFTTVASTPSAAAYSSATIAEDKGQGSYTYGKSTATQYELVGIVDPSISLNFTNTAIAAIWPVNMGYSNTDNFSGSASSGTTTGTASGTVNTVGSGTGTLVIPGGATFTNVLQMKSHQQIKLNFLFGIVTATMVATDYNYYHSSQKFPILTVNYTDISGAFTSTTASVKVNNAVITGLNNLNFDATFAIFPNPAKDHFNIKLDNVDNANCRIDIFNSVGQVCKSVDFGNNTYISGNIAISDLVTGIYVVKTTLGNKVSVRKLIIE